MKKNPAKRYSKLTGRVPFVATMAEESMTRRSVYERTGCVFCAFGITQESTPNRFHQLKDSHPKLWDYCMRPIDKGGLNMQEVLDYIGVPSGAVKSEMMSD